MPVRAKLDQLSTSVTSDILFFAPEYVAGTDGGDVLYGHKGNDTVIGGGGNDALWGGSGNDDLYGDRGPGLSRQVVHGNDILHGQGGNDRIFTGNGVKNTAYGESGDDALNGGTGRDYLSGGDGTDTIFGFGGNDTLLAGHSGPNGRDALNGGSGNDRLYSGSASTDVCAMTGGTGADTFIFAGGMSFVKDFEVGTDKLDLHSLGLTFDMIAKRDYADFIGTDALGDGTLLLDANGTPFALIEGVSQHAVWADSFLV